MAGLLTAPAGFAQMHRTSVFDFDKRNRLHATVAFRSTYGMLSAAIRGRMAMAEPFSAKLDLVLKALTMSRGRLAAELGVDKSLVGRWVSGAINPSAHNLANLTTLIAGRKPGFNLHYWEKDMAGLATLFGVDQEIRLAAPALAAVRPAPAVSTTVLPLEMVATARQEIERRGHSYEGLWRTTRPSSTEPGRFVREQVMIQQIDGLLQVRWATSAYEWSGWALLLHNQLYVMIGDIKDHSVVFLLLEGVNSQHAVELDGLMMGSAADRAKTPTACRVLFERIGVVCRDAEANARAFEAGLDAPFVFEAADIAEDVRAQLVRDFGPAAFAGGGQLLLQVPFMLNRSRGAFLPDAAIAS
jgi:transcriptional regulator with XRE-family HTH domain